MKRFALLLPILIAAAPVPPVQSYDSYGSWLVACDNGLSCVAKGFGDGAGRSELRIDRAEGAGGKLTATIAADARFGLGEVSVDGRPLRLAAKDWQLTVDGEVTSAATEIPAAVRVLVAALRAGKVLQPGGAEPVPLDGLSAALRRMDDRQGRAGGVTALIATGPRVAVPAAPPLPPVPTAPKVAALPPREAAQLIARVRAATRPVMAAEDCQADAGPEGPAAYALNPQRALVLLPCLMGAYQGSALGFVAPRGGGKPQRLILSMPYRGASADAARATMFTNWDYDEATATLSMFAKGRGLTDCGVSASWAWDGRRFRLTDMALQEACGGVSPGDWPTLYRSKP